MGFRTLFEGDSFSFSFFSAETHSEYKLEGDSMSLGFCHFTARLRERRRRGLRLNFGVFLGISDVTWNQEMTDSVSVWKGCRFPRWCRRERR